MEEGEGGEGEGGGGRGRGRGGRRERGERRERERERERSGVTWMNHGTGFLLECSCSCPLTGDLTSPARVSTHCCLRTNIHVYVG